MIKIKQMASIHRRKSYRKLTSKLLADDITFSQRIEKCYCKIEK